MSNLNKLLLSVQTALILSYILLWNIHGSKQGFSHLIRWNHIWALIKDAERWRLCLYSCLCVLNYSTNTDDVRARSFIQLCRTLGQFSLHSLLNNKHAQVYGP